MNRTARLVGLAALLTNACGGVAAAPPPAAAPQGDVTARLERFLTTAADSGFNGSVLVARDGRILLHRGYGWADSRRQDSVRTSTPFWIASISKQFAAAAILTLMEAGRLSIEDSIGRFLRMVPADKQGITLHRLLSHSAGLTQRYAADGIEDRDTAVQAILAQPLARPPGEAFGYSNDVYNLLAALVEIVAGVPYETYVQDRLLRPAGLTRTGFWGPIQHPEVAAILGEWDSTAARPNWGFRGATGMFSTAGDLYRWHLALEQHVVLSEPSVRRLLTAHVSTPGGTGVGYGWFVSKTSWGTTSSWTRGYESFGHGAVLAVYPAERVVIVVTSNSGERPRGVPVCHKLAEDLAGLLLSPR